MKNIITTDTASLSNGFQRGQWVKFLTHAGGKWEVASTRSTGSCTYNDDLLIEGMEVKLEGKGIVGGYRIEALTHLPYTTGFFGFTAEELAGPAPEKGYTCEMHGIHAQDWTAVETLEGYLLARFVNDSFTPWSSMKDGVHEMPYTWGCQSACSYALIIEHQLIESITDCGDNTPYLTETREKCLAERKLFTSSEREDTERERHECKQRTRTALELGWSEQWQDVANHLRSCYKMGQNPLPTLRKKFGGKWTYHQPGKIQENCVASEVRFTELSRLENEMVKCPEGFLDLWTNVWSRWQVSYVPATK